MAVCPSRLVSGLIASGLAAAFLSACSSTQQISRQQMMAPENMELAMRGDIAVVEFTGEGGQDVANRLSASLERVRLEGRPVFEVVSTATGVCPLAALSMRMLVYLSRPAICRLLSFSSASTAAGSLTVLAG